MKIYASVSCLVEYLGNTERTAPKLEKDWKSAKKVSESCLVEYLGNSKRSAPKLNKNFEFR